MSSWAAEIRRREAACRREQREARRLYGELERSLKEQARSSELAQAYLEVTTQEHAIEELTTIHKDQAASVEWFKYAAALPPHDDAQTSRYQFAMRLMADAFPTGSPLLYGTIGIEEARRLDQQTNQATHKAYRKKVAEWTRLRSLAKRVLGGEGQAYAEAISEFEPFAEIPGLRSAVRLSVSDSKLVGCELTVSGRDIIPAEAKTLTTTGKLSVKTMPKSRAQEIYQSYVCGCVLRGARELLALLPVDAVVVTASIDGIDERTGHKASSAVLSSAIDRATMMRLNFERLNPSEALQNFRHRGDGKTLRRSGELTSIVPLTLEEVAPSRHGRIELQKLLDDIQQLRSEIGASLQPLSAHNDARSDAALSPSDQ